MKFNLIIVLLLIAQFLFAQDKIDYLLKNRIDLTREPVEITEKDFNIIGFGALHGSTKTYEAELTIVRSLLEQHLLDYYIIETNFSQAYFFNEYLKSGNSELLKELTLSFESIVIQEGSIETYQHWVNLKNLISENPHYKFEILGFDVINEYKFPIKHLLELTKNAKRWKRLSDLNEKLLNPATNFLIWNNEWNDIFKNFIDDYNENKYEYQKSISDIESFEFVLKNIEHNLNKPRDRGLIMYENYLYFKNKLKLEDKKQFAKYGFSHILKNKEDKHSSLFTKLIENGIYDKTKVITIMVYLTKSQVLWDKKYNKQGDYTSYSIKKGYGIADYWKEYFKGIKYLKKTKLSDVTMFKLNHDDSPYKNGTDLIEIKLFLKDYNTTKLKGKNTLEFIDYAILISNSKAQIPIEEIHGKFNK